MEVLARRHSNMAGDRVWNYGAFDELAAKVYDARGVWRVACGLWAEVRVKVLVLSVERAVAVTRMHICQQITRNLFEYNPIHTPGPRSPRY